MKKLLLLGLLLVFVLSYTSVSSAEDESTLEQDFEIGDLDPQDEVSGCWFCSWFRESGIRTRMVRAHASG